MNPAPASRRTVVVSSVLLVLVGRHVLTSPWLVAVLFAAWGAVAVRGGFHNRRLWERFL